MKHGWVFSLLSGVTHGACVCCDSAVNAPSVRLAEQWESGAEHCSAAWAWLDADRSTVSRQNGRDDRQPETRAATVACSRWVGSEESLEYSSPVVIAEPRTAVGDPDDGLGVGRGDADRRLRARGGVQSDVGQQIVDHLAKPVAVATN